MQEGLLAKFFCDCDRADAPGWAAMDDRLAAVYGDAEPLYFGTSDPMTFGGTDPLEAISVYSVDGPAPHWHLVSFGSSELYHKEFNKPDISGFGFELTMRIVRRSGERSPPSWAMTLLQSLALFVRETTVAFVPGNHLDVGSPLAPDSDTGLRAVCFVDDQQLGSLETPNGFMRFLQVVGVTADEVDAMLDWDAQGVIDLLAELDPMMLTDLDRPSLFDDAALAAQIRARMDREGASASFDSGGDVRWEKDGDGVVVTLGALYVKAPLRGLRRRIPFERDYVLRARGRQLKLSPAGQVALSASDELLELKLTDAAAQTLADSVQDQRGLYRCSAVPGLTIIVEPIEIKDAEGHIVEVIG